MRSKSPDRERAILTAAASVFSELGIDRATMSDIVARVGGSKSTLYSYFASKEALVAAVMGEAAERLLQQAFHALDPDVPLPRALGSFGQIYLRHLLAPDMIAMTRLAQQQADQPRGGRLFYETGPLQGWRLMAEHLEQRMAQGEMRPADPWVAAMHLKGLLQAEYLDKALLGHPLPSAQKVGEAALLGVEVFLRAYAAPER